MIKNPPPLLAGPRHLPPTVLTIFGATGDLSADYLLPSLAHMRQHRMLPEDFHLVCVGRRDFDTRGFWRFMLKKSAELRRVPQAAAKDILKNLTYYRGDLDDPSSFAGLRELLADRERPRHVCYNRLYYFATAPDYFAPIARLLKDQGLLVSCAGHERKVRVLVEKPFGQDLKSARALNRLLLSFFTEDQIYRIDHYQGKETVQNLMVVRFANSLFEPLWNSRFVDHIEISVLETDDAAPRAAFYDKAGALRDFVQNHILQVLSLVAMDEPKVLSTAQIRREKLKVLNHLVPFTPKTAAPQALRGQYAGYRRDVGRRASQTETFVALKLFLDLPRWRGVPFYVRTGKALGRKVAEVSVHFRELPKCLFRGCAANVLTFKLQPDESVHLQLNNKVPGFGIELHQGDYEFGYQKAFAARLPSAYERLLLDFMEGDQRLFISSKETEAAWRFVDSVSKHWGKNPLHRYARGSGGPVEAEKFVTGFGHGWWTK